MNDDNLLTMKEIGKLFGVTSHVIGRKLKELKMRNKEGKPSPAAFKGHYYGQRFTQDYENYCWAWHAEKTITLLELAGMRRVKDEAPLLPQDSDVNTTDSAA